ncbi:hypothetical protein NP493_516g02045 [Ridgeia piscesae]|uniref:TIL domain-containing protein n=1 Tax=Ridgeia piscesae TaxID=27915 RepID=A0AAD9KXA8_RIDPI|nr:hypothetical protein NP493_516g02045 [Ridgeia piscesae]
MFAPPPLQRDHALSPAMACGPGMVHQRSAPACPPTCQSPDAPEKCDLPRTEGCVCANDTHVQEHGMCLPPESCHCIDDIGRHHESCDVGSQVRTRQCFKTIHERHPGPDPESDECEGVSRETRHCRCYTKLSKPEMTSAIPGVVIPDEITCVRFDAGRKGMKATKGVYVAVINVARERSAVVGSAGRFDGSGRLEIPRFTSSYAQWSQFGVSFWYKRDSAGNNGRQWLVSNSIMAHPSISIGSDPGHVKARLVTNAGSASVHDYR